ncbi:MAG: hypothetical protein HRT90_06955 [Candidatus Margulisbacteria bacterium]|nr:hypothetical protein [Candidatus Margulisiibacteriota bacterium]
MENKKCSDCKEEKLLSEFYTQSDRKNGASSCKQCFNKYCTQRWIDRKMQAIEYKGCKCQDCPASHPEEPYVIFDFHHLDPKEKDVSWNKLRLRSWEKIKEELDKCILLCSNCHRKRHHNE